MKRRLPVEIDLVAFFLTGRFDRIVPGQTAGWIEANFPAPDHQSDMGGGLGIWAWGAIEFHFDHGLLYQIWCDDFDQVADGPALAIRRGWLERPARLSLRWVLGQLNQERAGYQVGHDPVHPSVRLQVSKSGVEFHFEPGGAPSPTTQPELWRMQAFGLSHPDYRRPPPSPGR